MNEELKKDVEAAVASIFSQKEEAEQRAETEKALNKSAETITSLTEALEGKNADKTTVEKLFSSLSSSFSIADLTKAQLEPNPDKDKRGPSGAHFEIDDLIELLKVLDQLNDAGEEGDA